MATRVRKCGLVLFVCLLAGGCTQAGSFVTSISSSGPNTLLIEKCHVHMNAFTGMVSNDQCTTHQLTLQVQSNDGK